MKTKKYLVYALISVLVFFLFLNFESWATSRPLPIMMHPIMVYEACPVIVPVCYQIGTQTCCESYCCTSTDYSNCVLRGSGPICTPPGTGTTPQK
jgi:hypothetical protein